MNPDYPNLPYVGQFVDYYPSNSQRLCALVTEVHPHEIDGTRPHVNLCIFNPDASQDTGEDIEPVDETKLTTDPDNIDLTGCWGFAHEFDLTLDEETDGTLTPLGTQSNLHVGTQQSY